MHNDAGFPINAKINNLPSAGKLIIRPIAVVFVCSDGG